MRAADPLRPQHHHQRVDELLLLRFPIDARTPVEQLVPVVAELRVIPALDFHDARVRGEVVVVLAPLVRFRDAVTRAVDLHDRNAERERRQIPVLRMRGRNQCQARDLRSVLVDELRRELAPARVSADDPRPRRRGERLLRGLEHEPVIGMRRRQTIREPDDHDMMALLGEPARHRGVGFGLDETAGKEDQPGPRRIVRARTEIDRVARAHDLDTAVARQHARRQVLGVEPPPEHERRREPERYPDPADDAPDAAAA